jgi:hypothetical protein
MRQLRGLIVITLMGIILTACFGSSDASDSGSPSATPSAPPSGTPPASTDDSGEPSAEPSAEPIPSDELGPFTCDLPIHVDQTIGHANITDVRVGAHADYDRVVFEFAGGLPEASLERAEPPFTQDASGLPIDVEGESFLRLILRGGTKQTDEGTSSYDGPTDFAVDQHTLVHLIEGGDFEAQSTWYFGLTEEECLRVFTLEEDGTARLIIDIEH